MKIAKLADGRKISFPNTATKKEIEDAVKRMVGKPVKKDRVESIEMFDRAASKVASSMHSSVVATSATNEKLAKSIEDLELRIADFGDMKKVFSSMETLSKNIGEQVKKLGEISAAQTQGVDAAVSKVVTSQMQGFLDRLLQQNAAFLQEHAKQMAGFAKRVEDAIKAPRELELKKDYRGEVTGAKSVVNGGGK